MDKRSLYRTYQSPNHGEVLMMCHFPFTSEILPGVLAPRFIFREQINVVARSMDGRILLGSIHISDDFHHMNSLTPAHGDALYDSMVETLYNTSTDDVEQLLDEVKSRTDQAAGEEKAEDIASSIIAKMMKGETE